MCHPRVTLACIIMLTLLFAPAGLAQEFHVGALQAWPDHDLLGSPRGASVAVGTHLLDHVGVRLGRYIVCSSNHADRRIGRGSAVGARYPYNVSRARNLTVDAPNRLPSSIRTLAVPLPARKSVVHGNIIGRSAREERSYYAESIRQFALAAGAYLVYTSGERPRDAACSTAHRRPNDR